MRGVMGDLAFTVRALLRRPAFLLLSVSTLAVGIGAATTVFSVAEAVLLRDPPLPEAHRLVSVYSTNPTVGKVDKVELKGLSTAGELVGEFADVSSCQYVKSGMSCTRYAAPDASSGDFLFSPEEPSFKDPFSEVHAYYHVDGFHR